MGFEKRWANIFQTKFLGIVDTVNTKIGIV